MTEVATNKIGQGLDEIKVLGNQSTDKFRIYLKVKMPAQSFPKSEVFRTKKILG